MSDFRTSADGIDAPVDPRSGTGRELGRRAMLQSLAGAFGAGFVLPFVAEGHPIHAHLADQAKVATADATASKADYTPEFVDAHQLATLDALAERIIPGSTAARVAPFLDSLLAVSATADQRRFLNTLGAFEMLAIDRHRKPWTALTPSEQDALLTHASTAGPGPSSAASSDAGRASGNVTIRDAFDDLRGWISGAYYSSEAGMRELGWTGNAFFDKLPGCDHPGGHP